MLENYYVIFLNILSQFPAGILCFVPMRGKMRGSIKKTILTVFVPYLAFIAISALVATVFDIRPYFIRIPVILFFFLIYYKSLDIHITKAVFVCIHVYSVVVILYSLANGCDALIHPQLGAGSYTLSDSLLQLLFVSVYTLLVFWPVKKYGSELFEKLSSPRVWISASLIPGIVLVVNLLMRVEKYESLYVNRVFHAFFAIHIVSFVMIMVLTIFFYYVVSGILRETRTLEELKILKLQERYFKAQQQYMNDTARARHDFKHTIHTLERLASDGDLSEIKNYLSRYSDSMPKNEISYYCENMAVNALLNYYMEQAKKAKTSFTLEVDMPQKLPITDVEMCAVLGNILENAMMASMEIATELRYIDLAIRVENDSQLYIVVQNSFNGIVRVEDGKYYTTHSGNGIGLGSVMTVAQSCGGTARFSHEGTDFFSDVILPLNSAVRTESV
ncbi:MAG: ATP-binding protein [Lachnospiraceae bacterium]|nr:ATP-binding protein [Lachnospiraceae bacterium]